jgi:hypothetical protein
MNETDPVAIRLAKDDNGPVTVGVVWFLCAFAAVFLGLRLYAKITRQQGLWWDDYILISSWVCRSNYHPECPKGAITDHIRSFLRSKAASFRPAASLAWANIPGSFQQKTETCSFALRSPVHRYPVLQPRSPRSRSGSRCYV